MQLVDKAFNIAANAVRNNRLKKKTAHAADHFWLKFISESTDNYTM